MKLLFHICGVKTGSADFSGCHFRGFPLCSSREFKLCMTQSTPTERQFIFAQFDIYRFSTVENELQREFEKGIKPGLANLQKSTSDGRPSKLVYIRVNQYTGYKSVSEVVFRFDIPSDTARLFVGFDFKGCSPCELNQPLQLLANDIMWMKRKGRNRQPVGFALEALYFRSFEDDNTVIRCASRTWPLPDPFVTDRVLCMCFVNE